MTHSYQERANEARELLKQQDYKTAGDLYSFSAYSALGKSEYTATMVLGSSIYWYLCASLCYRLAGTLSRCRNRCKQGMLVCEDLRENVWDEPVRTGLTHELVGDFRILAGLNEHQRTYDRAKEYYVDCDNPIGWAGEPEFELPMLFFLRMAASTDHEIDAETISKIRSFALMDRINYKREYFESVVKDVVDDGYFEY